MKIFHCQRWLVCGNGHKRPGHREPASGFKPVTEEDAAKEGETHWEWGHGFGRNTSCANVLRNRTQGSRIFRGRGNPGETYTGRIRFQHNSQINTCLGGGLQNSYFLRDYRKDGRLWQVKLKTYYPGELQQTMTSSLKYFDHADEICLFSQRVLDFD